MNGIERNKGGMMTWISVEDRLPGENSQVLTFGAKQKNIHDDGLSIITAVYRKGKFESDHFCESSYVENVTHWMPLPEPPT